MTEQAAAPQGNRILGGATFVVYCIYTIDYYVRVLERTQVLAALRPTLLLFGVIVIMLLAQLPHLKGRLTDRPARALFALFIYLALSLPFVTWPGSVLHNLNPYVRAVAFFVFTALIVDTERKLFAFLLVFVGCQLFRVLDPLYLHVTTGYLGQSTYVGHGEFEGRLSGAPFDVVNPNGLGFVTAGCIPFLYYCLYGAKQFYRKVLAVTLIGACLFVIYLTLSRGAMIATLVFVWLVFRGTKRKVLFVAGLAVAVGIAWGQFGGVHKDRYLSLLHIHPAHGSVQATEDATAYGRVQVTEEEFDIGMERPIFGHGLGTTAEAKVHDGHGPQVSHNLYTELLVEIGVVGGFFFLRFVYAIYCELREALRMLARDQERPTEDIYRRLISALVALFWMYLVFSANYWGLSQDYWYALAGLVSASVRQIQASKVLQPATAMGGEVSMQRGNRPGRGSPVRSKLATQLGRPGK